MCIVGAVHGDLFLATINLLFLCIDRTRIDPHQLLYEVHKREKKESKTNRIPAHVQWGKFKCIEFARLTRLTLAQNAIFLRCQPSA